MKGSVDELGRAMVTLSVRASPHTEPTAIEVWIDTAFDGELVMPRPLIERVQLEQTGGIEARLADGSAVMLESFACFVDWFGKERRIEVIANEGRYPLLGIGLLLGHRLVVDYTHRTVVIE